MSAESRYFSGDQSLQVLGSFMNSDQGNWSSVFCLCDENTHRHCYPALELSGIKSDKVIVTGAGEKHKDLHTLSVVWGELLKGGADRHSLLLNLGGGMITDLGGMAASTFMRGIPFVNLPTTLLAMVDAAIGGKTGIDIHGGKNLAGTFASAEATIAHYPFLDTLPDAEWKNGMAEMIKHLLIADAAGWDGMYDAIRQKSDQHALREFFKNGIRESAAIKFRIVAEDPFEKGVRAALNFGHTIGHAFESWSLDSSHGVIPHGHAVAAGMICESYLASKLAGLSQNDLTQIVSSIDHIFPRIRISREERGHVLEKIRLDKKRSSGKVRLALISAPGIPRIQVECETELIAESLHFYSS